MKSEDVGAKEWDLSLRSEVRLKETIYRHRLDKLLQEVCPHVGDGWKHTAFPPGTLPTLLARVQLRVEVRAEGLHPQVHPLRARGHVLLFVADREGWKGGGGSTMFWIRDVWPS